jgi:hypothetical protein
MCTLALAATAVVRTQSVASASSAWTAQRQWALTYVRRVTSAASQALGASTSGMWQVWHTFLKLHNNGLGCNCNRCTGATGAPSWRLLMMHIMLSAGHRMLEQKPVYDVLHLLKVLHPDKSFMELHQLLRFAAVRHRDVHAVRVAET